MDFECISKKLEKWIYAQKSQVQRSCLFKKQPFFPVSRVKFKVAGSRPNETKKLGGWDGMGVAFLLIHKI